MSNSEELFDIVDEKDDVIGQAPRRECHGNPQLVHRAVHVLVFNRDGDLLLQKRSMNKDIQPGKWDTSVGGHLDCGETYIAAAYREMKEELGLSGLPLTFLYKSQIRNAIESENVKTYLAITDQKMVFCSDEIAEIRYWKPAQINEALGTGQFTPNFEEEWQMLLDHLRCYQVSPDQGIGLCAGDSFPNVGQGLYAECKGS